MVEQRLEALSHIMATLEELIQGPVQFAIEEVKEGSPLSKNAVESNVEKMNEVRQAIISAHDKALAVWVDLT